MNICTDFTLKSCFFMDFHWFTKLRRRGSTLHWFLIKINYYCHNYCLWYLQSQSTRCSNRLCIISSNIYSSYTLAIHLSCINSFLANPLISHYWNNSKWAQREKSIQIENGKWKSVYELCMWAITHELLDSKSFFISNWLVGLSN